MTNSWATFCCPGTYKKIIINYVAELRIYQNFIEGHNLTSEQERYLKNILDYVSLNGDIQTKNFTEYPLKALNWRVTFGDHFVNLKDFVKQIHQVISATA